MILIEGNTLLSVKKKSNINNNIFEHLSDNASSDHLSDNGSTVNMDISINPGDNVTGDSYNSRY